MYYDVMNNDENASRFLSVEKEFQTEQLLFSIAERITEFPPSLVCDP